MMLAFIYLNLKLHLHAEKAAPASAVSSVRCSCSPRAPRAHSSAASALPKMPNTKRVAKTTPGRDTHRGAPQRLRILESDSSSSDEDDFVDRDRRSSTATSRAGVRPTLPPQQRTPMPTVVPNSHATSPSDARPPTPPTAATPPPGDMNDAISSAQGPPPYSPSSPGEVGDDDGMFDFDFDDDDGGIDGVGSGPIQASPVGARSPDAAAANVSTPAASATANATEVTPSPLPATVGNAAGATNSATCDFVVTLGGLYCKTCKKPVLGRLTWFTKEDALRRHLKSNSSNAEIKNVPKLLEEFTTQLFSIHSRADNAMVMAEFPSDSTTKKNGYYCHRCAA